jgi:hypothetical protein
VGKDCDEINQTMANGKRFMAYEIVRRLQAKEEKGLLRILQRELPHCENKKGQRHRVFKHSFDAKPCYGLRFFETKLNYIHNNPCQKRWRLVDYNYDYAHSSARYYVLGQHADYPVHDYRLLPW